MEDWTMVDKKKLLTALQMCGNTNIAAVQKHLPHKTITDLRLAFEKYSFLASEKMNNEEKLREEDSAINQWIQIAKKACDQSNGVIDIVPRVLKYIALFEKRPYDKEVNLRDCYMALSEMSAGMVSKNLNQGTNQFFFKNLSKLALKIKKNDSHKKKLFIKRFKDVEVHPPLIKTYNRKKKKTNVILNPLNVPDDLLKDEEGVLNEGL